MPLAIALVVAGTLVVAADVSAQAPQPTPSAAPTPLAVPPPLPPGVRASDLTSLEVQVVITRLDGGKVVSALPYTLAVTTNAGEAQLNMGAEVPLPQTILAPPATGTAATGGAATGPATPASRLTQVTYRPLGTIITCRALKADDGRYQLVLQVDDSTQISNSQAAQGGDGMPSFRSFRSRNTIMLADGQTRQYTVAADRVSGEVVRLEVTMRVVK